MNREIKFRGLRTDGKGWVYGYYRKCTFYNKLGDEPKEIYTKHFIGSFSNLDLFDGIFEQVEVIPESVSQFTGLKDKNDQEIYEGDVCKNVYYPLGANKEIYEYSIIGVIEYEYNCFGFVHKFDVGKQLIPEKCMSHQKNRKEISQHSISSVNYFQSDFFSEKLEVIGNIYENPELL